jgi:hypothetical protein
MRLQVCYFSLSKPANKIKFIKYISNIVDIKKKLYNIEFDDGSDWTLSKCLTHANRTT